VDFPFPTLYFFQRSHVMLASFPPIQLMYFLALILIGSSHHIMISYPFISPTWMKFFNSSHSYSIGFSRPVNRTFTSRLSKFKPTTFPLPSGVLTTVPKSGSAFFANSYSSFSYCKQHIKRPHKPDILVGFKDKF